MIEEIYLKKIGIISYKNADFPENIFYFGGGLCSNNCNFTSCNVLKIKT